ncbi:MAG: AAA family ATPase [Clostridiaceae bacterium]
MLKKVSFKNFRCFASSELTLRDISIIVGQNNAGKSSIVEALRLIAHAGNRSKSKTNYVSAPKGFQLPSFAVGFFIKPERLKIDPNTAIYFYKTEETAIITAEFSDKGKIQINIHNGEVFATFYDREGINIRARKKVLEYEFDTIAILPQIGLIKDKEVKLSEETIVSDKDTYLTSRHFRNEIWLYRTGYFNEFKQLAEQTWHGLKIDEIKYNPYQSDYLELFIQDAGFPAEIGLMGSGIQMWLQIIWFICRSKLAQTIILDEPDVYMHPDMQKRILYILKQRYQQIIIATHSVELIASVEPRCIVAVDRESRKTRYANSSAAVQRVIDSIGSVHNLALLRIAIAKKCVFVEGEDLKILTKFQLLLNPELSETADSLPVVSLGGFSRYAEAFGAARLFYEESAEIKTFCLLDHDYYPNEYFQDLEREAKDNHLLLHVWRKKEIENYVLVPSAIFRSIKISCDFSYFITEFTRVVDDMREEVSYRIAAKIQDYFKSSGLDFVTAQKRAAIYMKENWTTLERKIALVNGKELLSRVNEWLRDKYCVSTSLDRIIRSMKPDEVDEEITEVLCLLSSR